MGKRKRSSSFAGARKKSRGKRSLKVTGPTGDIAKSIIDRFATSIVKPDRIHKTAVRLAFSSVNGGLTTGNAYSYNFKLSDVSQYADYANVYDQYRIVAIDLYFQPDHNTFQNALQNQSRMFSVLDFDDAVSLTGANAARGYNNCIITSPWEKCHRRFVPRCALAAYSGAFTSYAQAKNAWLDMASPGVLHYGVKIWIDPATTIVAQWFVEAIYYLEFKGSRVL